MDIISNKPVKDGLKTAKEKEVKKLNGRFMKYTEGGEEIGMDNRPTLEMTMNQTYEQYAKGLIRFDLITEEKVYSMFIKEDAVMSMIFTANDSSSQLADMIRDDKANAMEQLRQEVERKEFQDRLDEGKL